MHKPILAGGLLAAGLLQTNPGFADDGDDHHHNVDEIVVTAAPLERSVEQLAQPTGVLDGDALIRNQASSIGETLADQPGVTASYFGPVASRPVIRGQFGERVRVLANGLDALDASALSEDHAVSLDSILAERVEIVRGPATLLYGSGAAGGLVNVVDSRFPELPLDENFAGTLALGSDSATGRRSAALALDGGGDEFVWHVDAFRRDTDDLEIPGFAESAILRAGESGDEEEAFGRIENSDSETTGGATSFSLIGDNSRVGFAISRYDTNYGVPAPHGHEDEAEEEEAIRIDLEQTRYDLQGELGFERFVESINFRLSNNDYTHTELENGEVGTIFDTRGLDTRVEFRFAPGERFEGAAGMQYKRIDFVAIGDEAFVPPSDTEQFAVFLFEELGLSDSLTLQGSARAEYQNLTSPMQLDYDDWAFGASLGAIADLSESLSLAANLAYTERHPNSTELYALGPHLAVQRFEIGSLDQGLGLLDKERSTNLDVTLRAEAGRFDASLTVFRNLVDDYILLRPTGGIIDELPVYQYGQADVDMYGFESELLIDLIDNGSGHLHARLSADYVFAEESASGEYLARIPPLRTGFALHYTHPRFEARVEAQRYREQTKVASNELPTDGYTLIGAEISTRIADDSLLLFLKGSNLGDEDARRHSSPIKDAVPLPGRSIALGLRWDF